MIEESTNSFVHLQSNVKYWFVFTHVASRLHANRKQHYVSTTTEHDDTASTLGIEHGVYVGTIHFRTCQTTDPLDRPPLLLAISCTDFFVSVVWCVSAEC